MEKRAIIAFVASLVVLIGWELLFSPPKPVKQPAPQQQQAPVAPAAPEAAKALPQAVPGTLPQGAPAEAPAVARTWTVETPRYTAAVVDAGARV